MTPICQKSKNNFECSVISIVFDLVFIRSHFSLLQDPITQLENKI